MLISLRNFFTYTEKKIYHIFILTATEFFYEDAFISVAVNEKMKVFYIKYLKTELEKW